MNTALQAIDWKKITDQINERGYAHTPVLLPATECRRLAALYEDAARFRSVINMQRYNFGSGEYKYFSYPLPDVVEKLRTGLYPPLARIANDWARLIGEEPRWPDKLSTLLDHCHANEQPRPTPLMLRYGPGDYNCLHQDLYGPIHFPMQVIVALSAPDEDYEGGDLVLVEQRPRMQSRPMVVRPPQGSAVIIPVRERPRQGVRGYHRVQMRHGVSEITAGQRVTLGLIFHDAR